MADPNDAGGGAGGRSPEQVRVNGRRLHFDLTTGEITKGPGALVGKFICAEQMADILEAGNYVGRLFAVDREDDLRLAEAEYAFLKPKEREMKTEVTPGITVEYGRHGRYRVVGMDDIQRDAVVLEEASGKRIAVPLHRYQNETTISAEPLEHTPVAPVSADPYEAYGAGAQTTEATGSVHLDDGDIDRAVMDRVAVLFESDAFVARITEAVARKLATTFTDEGQESPGDAIANSGDDNGAIEA